MAFVGPSVPFLIETIIFANSLFSSTQSGKLVKEIGEMMNIQVIVEGSMNSSNPYFSSTWRRNFFVWNLNVIIYFSFIGPIWSKHSIFYRYSVHLTWDTNKNAKISTNKFPIFVQASHENIARVIIKRWPIVFFSTGPDPSSGCWCC